MIPDQVLHVLTLVPSNLGPAPFPAYNSIAASCAYYTFHDPGCTDFIYGASEQDLGWIAARKEEVLAFIRLLTNKS